MKLELETVLKGKIGDYREAETLLEDAARGNDDGEINRDDDVKKTQQDRDGAGCGDQEDGHTTAKQDKQSRKKVRIVPAKGLDQHAGGDHATADEGGIITRVLGTEQVKRAEATENQGQRV